MINLVFFLSCRYQILVSVNHEMVIHFLKRAFIKARSHAQGLSNWKGEARGGKRGGKIIEGKSLKR